ncbi:hypothetical protein AVMA1855_07760 [Acidovorax sp. SUPP1855]|uniref:M15 family metallopeptidase n=1 Tax=Acidovorax sp. SUPP1855 TaxID=431774 RepID=UPI0023DE20FE|nr:M15 family metallopeptidase [Acidovorax sp. SUPP1855]GKS84026.1 hypothetical protein AVMA1855_07760 [Acidovorax sp. SUPP1855]
MPDIKDSVGEGAKNQGHDVALLQAMLRVIKDAKNAPYLSVDYDGSYGGQTRAAIERFQIDQKLAQSPVAKAAAAKGPAAVSPVPAAAGGAQETLGLVAPGSATLQKINAMLPATHQAMRSSPGSKTVYIAADAKDAATSKAAIASDAEYEPTFRAKLSNLVQQMYDTHEIVLWITPTGRRRTFAQQAAETQTNAGPGESNHNFGRAADIGFRRFQWVKGNGVIATDADWLNGLEAAKAGEATRWWNERDLLAAKEGLLPLNFERVHLQAFAQKGVSNQRSLAQLLNAVSASNMRWKAAYQADLQSQGKYWANVGTAKAIWAGNAAVTKSDLAKARTAATGKQVKDADIAQAEVDAMRKTLKADFQAADDNWVKWTAVP